MKILYLLSKDADETLIKIMDEHRKVNEVAVTDIRENKDYMQLMKLIESNDRVISW